MLLHSAHRCPHRVLATTIQANRSNTFRAFYATIRGLRQPSAPQLEDEPTDNDFILSILRANPSLRDSRSYLAAFGPRHRVKPNQGDVIDVPPISGQKQTVTSTPSPPPLETQQLKTNTLAAAILNPIHRRTALVKVQGPFTDKQLESIARGMVYLEKLGLVSVIVVESDALDRGDEGERSAVVDETMRVVSALEKQGAQARPVLGSIVRLGPKPGEDEGAAGDILYPEGHTLPADLVPIRSSLRAGEIPVLPPLALDSFCRSVRVDANDVIAALARGMVEAAALDGSRNAPGDEQQSQLSDDIDLTPLRLMIINREGGVPSYARSGYPHLLINLTSEYSYINKTFLEPWRHSNPTALSNLSLARTCLSYMPPTSSAIMVSHRSPSSLIANLITNKPAVSSSLPHALLQGASKLTQHTPTLIRRGVPIRVLQTVNDIDKMKMKTLLEQSFGRILDEESFYQRLEKKLDYVIVAGDYAGAAIVTKEPCPGCPFGPIAYLDKFAVLPQNQGDGTVDFLWVALHDESYGLGDSFSANPNGGKQGRGEGRDLVWRSRSDNPVNKWYFERSSGHLRMGKWVLFWCDAEKRLKKEEGRRGSSGLSYIEEWEVGRVSSWAKVVPEVASSWK